MRIALVAGARPNFVKVAALHAALAARPGADVRVLHTGQHHDEALSGSFWRQLGLPEPDAHFGVGSGSHAAQTGGIMVAFEAWLEEAKPDLVVVVGDVNSSLAAALVAAKARVTLAHVEAGLRSFDRTMPEELNRIVIDALADLHFATEAAAVANLRREGVPSGRIHLVGNVMIDTLLRFREDARHSDVLTRLGLPGGTHAVVTLHRPSNVDPAGSLGAWLEALATLAQELPVVLPVHPRTRARCREHGLEPLLEAPGLACLEPLPYLDFVRLLETARVAITDSGGVQEESTVLGVPCLTARESTERPVTVEHGTNRVMGASPRNLLPAWRALASEGQRAGRTPDLWDGHAAERIADVLLGPTGAGDDA